MTPLKYFVRKNTWLTRGLIDFGWGNGYVVIPEGHKCYGLDYNQIEEKYEIDVHGGLTFSAMATEIDFQSYGINPNDWVIGFDTCHAGDTLRRWTKTRVELAAKNLADQISKL